MTLILTLRAVLTILSGFSIIIGMRIIKDPRKTIEWQSKFYRKINWNMEPVSMEQEIRNTKMMGYASAIGGVLLFVLTLGI